MDWDKEKAIFNGLKRSMPTASNNLCIKHMKDNILRKLTLLRVGQYGENQFCRDIFVMGALQKD